MAQVADDARFVEEHRGEGRVADEARQQRLEHDALGDAGHRRARDEQLGHPALGEPLLDDVAAAAIADAHAVVDQRRLVVEVTLDARDALLELPQDLGIHDDQLDVGLEHAATLGGPR